MRIVFLLSQDLECPSGLGRYWPLAKELRKLGREVTILALHSNYGSLRKQEKEFIREGVRIRYVGQMHVRKIGNRKLYYGPVRLLSVVLLATIRLTCAALGTAGDAYHVGKPHPMNGVAGLIASKLRRKPLYVDYDDYEAASNRVDMAWQNRVIAFFEDRLPDAAAAISVNTLFIRERLIKAGYPSERLFHVPNGVDRERFSSINQSSADLLRRQLGLRDSEVILYLGSLSLGTHSVDLLLEAVPIVQQARPKAVLLIVGRGEDYDTLRQRARAMNLQEAIRFVGWISPANVVPYYLLADVSVDPVRDNQAQRARSPLKIVESLVVGTPVVTGDVGDRSMYLESSLDSALVTAGDPAALAAGIVSVLKRRDATPSKPQSRAESPIGYFWDNLVHDFVRVYDQSQ